MSKRAKEKALELFPIDIQMCIDNKGKPYEADVNEHRRKYVAFGYEQAEKDTIERAIQWLTAHADDYIVDMEVSRYKPSNLHVGGMCWEHLKQAMEDE